MRIVHYTHLIIDKESVFMVIEAKELSKIYGSGENRVVALDKAGLKIGQGDFISK